MWAGRAPTEFDLLTGSGAFTILPTRRSPATDTGGDVLQRAEVVVFSFVGVLGITLALFFVVALTARLILGR